MTADAGSGRHQAPVSAALSRLVAEGALLADPGQEQAAGVLDGIAGALSETPGLLDRLRGRRGLIRGAYLVGDVGRGKTMLMDLFFSAVPITEKRRLHFHQFMDEVHAAIALHRARDRDGRDDADPVRAVARPMAAGTRLLCLDEFQVSDITNAMLLGRLFEALFAGGVTLVATSNTPPDELYADGLNRQLFLPFVALLKQHAQIVPIDGVEDYRRLKFEGQQVFRFGTGKDISAGMDALWLRLTGGVAGIPAIVESLGRIIQVPRAAMGAARFRFPEICEVPLGARDYLRIAHSFDTVMIEDVPQFDAARTDPGRRFLLLVDTLYDRGIKLAASFAVPLDQLCRNDRLAPEFARTISRLYEMQSGEYLAAAHKPATSPAG